MALIFINIIIVCFVPIYENSHAWNFDEWDQKKSIYNFIVFTLLKKEANVCIK